MPERLTYEQTMALGQEQYQEAIDALRTAGLRTSFTQTGGMNAALEVALEGGFTLLVTEAEDSLSWIRDHRAGWAVALYAPQDQYDGAPLATESSSDSSTQALVELADRVLRRVL